MLRILTSSYSAVFWGHGWRSRQQMARVLGGVAVETRVAFLPRTCRPFVNSDCFHWRRGWGTRADFSLVTRCLLSSCMHSKSTTRILQEMVGGYGTWDLVLRPALLQKFFTPPCER